MLDAVLRDAGGHSRKKTDIFGICGGSATFSQICAPKTASVTNSVLADNLEIRLVEHKPTDNRSGMIVVVLALYVVLACGCGPKYGGRRQLVVLTTDPPGATAYVLTYRVWLENGAQRVLTNQSLLELYRRKEGVTPIEAPLDPYEQVFVADWNGQKEFTRFTPKAGKSVKLALRPRSANK